MVTDSSVPGVGAGTTGDVPRGAGVDTGAAARGSDAAAMANAGAGAAADGPAGGGVAAASSGAERTVPPGDGTTAPTGADAHPAVVRIAGRTDRRRVGIGTPFRYTMEIRAPRGVELMVPVLAGQLGAFSAIDFGEEPPREEGFEVVVTRWYALVAYEPGYQLIPGITVQYRAPGGPLGRADGEDLGITVESALAENAAADIRDIKRPVAVPFDWTPVVAGCGVLAGIGGLAWVAARLLRRINAPAAAPAPRPADVEALEALARLRHRRSDDPQALATWYIAVSAVVRVYIERRFGVRAPEMTTEEFIFAAQRDARLRPQHRELLGEFLAGCDLVKFARYVPDAAAADRAYTAASTFVTETRPASTEETASAA
jgi:hypothetical protein